MSFATTLRAALSPVAFAVPPGPLARLRVGPLDHFDRWALAVVGVVALVLLVSVGKLRPSMSDTWYHLDVARHFISQGGIPGWDDWNYAPLGRPHLYPPLLHLLLVLVTAFTRNLIHTGQLFAVVFYPLSLLSAWYATRWLLGSRAGLLAVVLLLTDMMHLVIMEAYIAGCLVNILMPLLLVAFLSRRPWWSILLMTLMYYSHLGLPHFVALGLLLFGFKYRVYWRLALKTVVVSLIFFTPWLAHVLGNLDWLPVLEKGGIPGGLMQKLFSLQSFNLVLLGLGFWGLAAAPRSQPRRMLPMYLLLGFVPLLLSYGGRYSMHTMPLWALLGGSVAQRLLPEGVRMRRVLGLVLATLLPLPTIGFFGQKPQPLPIAASHLLLITAISRHGFLGEGDKNEAYRADCEQLAAWLEKNTRPDEIIHVNTTWVADMISLLSDRVTDSGAWWECSQERATLYNRALRDWEPRSVFVCIPPKHDAGSLFYQTPRMPGVDRRFTIGRFEVGIRDGHGLQPSGRTVRGWQPLRAPGAGGTVTETATGFVWKFRTGESKLALITAPLHGGEGLSFRLQANAMTGDLVLGLHLADGTDVHWPLSVPDPDAPCSVRVPFKWLTDEAGKQHWPGEVREVYFACPVSKEHKKAKDWRVEVSELVALERE